jgi:hypothetical protein
MLNPHLRNELGRADAADRLRRAGADRQSAAADTHRPRASLRALVGRAWSALEFEPADRAPTRRFKRGAPRP